MPIAGDRPDCRAGRTRRRCAPAGAQDLRAVYLVIGYSVGGGYDAYARLLSRYFGKHLPGNPTIVPQQMAGAGSLRAANYIYTVAPKDGSVFGTFSRSMGISPLVDKAEFDSRKFTWLGSVTDDNTVCVSSAASPIKNWDGFLEQAVQVRRRGRRRRSGYLGADVQECVRRQDQSHQPGTPERTTSCWRWTAVGQPTELCGLSWSTIKNAACR